MEALKNNKEYIIWLVVSICLYFLNDIEKTTDMQGVIMIVIDIIYAVMTIKYRKIIFNFNTLNKK